MPIIWNAHSIRELVKKKFNKRACWYQIKTALSLHKKKDVVGTARTGAGKTLSFWVPLAMELEEGHDKMIFVTTPLNLLGKQNVDALKTANLEAISVTAENNNEQTYKVCDHILSRTLF